jgi:hypothetical protein
MSNYTCGSRYISIGHHCCKDSYKIGTLYCRYFIQLAYLFNTQYVRFTLSADTLQVNKENSLCHNRAYVTSNTILFVIMRKNNLPY